MPNEWHGPDRSIVAIAERRFFWVVGSLVVCLGGPDTPRTGTGGTKPPAPYKRRTDPVAPGGNVATGGLGGFDETVEKIVIRPADAARYVTAAPKRMERSRSPLARELRRLLDEEVSELVDGWPWAPFVVELGISGEERHFWRTAETMQVVSLALPHISDKVKTRALRFLDALFEAGCPLETPAFAGGRGRRREHYELGPGMIEFARRTPRYAANVEDIYALWAYARFADRWDDVLAERKAVERVFTEFASTELASKPLQFDHNDKDGDAAERLNGRIAGVLAYARIMGHVGERVEVERATTLLASLATERVHHERADTAFVRSTRIASHGLHQAKVPRYVALVPEVGGLLHERARVAVERNVRGLTRELPVWYQAFGERMIGGENYVSPPHLARGLFAALADAVRAGPEELARFLDQPWCRADLYYIEKLSAVLRALDGVR